MWIVIHAKYKALFSPISMYNGIRIFLGSLLHAAKYRCTTVSDHPRWGLHRTVVSSASRYPNLGTESHLAEVGRDVVFFKYICFSYVLVSYT